MRVDSSTLSGGASRLPSSHDVRSAMIRCYDRWLELIGCRILYLISDLDGTLVNIFGMIWRSHFEALRQTLLEWGASKHMPETLEQFISDMSPRFGVGPHAELTAALRLYAPEQFENHAIDADALVARLNRIQDELAPEYLRAFEGLDRFLRSLGTEKTSAKGQSMSLAIVTSGIWSFVFRSFSYALPAKLGMRDLYCRTDIDDTEKAKTLIDAIKKAYGFHEFAIVTRADVDRPKPHPDGIFVALRRLGGTASRAAYLGDHHTDMIAARAAGIRWCIGISHPEVALCDKRELTEAGATHHATNFEEVKLIIMSA